jgi:FtsH-binding integral membrane protein
MHDSGIKIWFFIGLSLLVNGVLITGAGIWEWIHPPTDPVVLFHLHSSIWWGAVLTALGLFYCIKFAPKRSA